MNTTTVKELPFQLVQCYSSSVLPSGRVSSVKKLHNPITIWLWLIFSISSPTFALLVLYPGHTILLPALRAHKAQRTLPFTYVLHTPVYRPKPLTTLGSFQRKLILCAYLHYLVKQPKLHRNKGVYYQLYQKVSRIHFLKIQIQ